MDWPIFYKDELKISNSQSSIGICTLWTRKDLVHSKVPEEKFAVCGNLYTIQGINPLLKNILSNPKIRYIILCGADLMKSGEALMALMQNGIDSERKIIGASGYIDSNVDPSLIQKFRESVQVIDLRGHEADVPAVLETLNGGSEPFMEPVFITELEKTAAPIKTEEVALRIRGKNISETWLRAVNVVMKFGEEKDSDYKIKQKEFVDLVAIIDEDDEKLAEWLNITEKDLENYYATFFSPEKPAGVEYTYGERLFKFTLTHVPGKFLEEVEGTQDQIEAAAAILKYRPYTRRAVAFTLREGDSKSKSPPCLTQITWHIRDGKLVQTAIFRSHDIFGAWVLNAFALRRLQKKLSEKIGIPAGKMVIISNSAHIYENNWKQAAAMLEKFHHDKIVQFVQDENGYFIVKVENGEIIVEHYTKQGLPTGFIFRGTKAQTLYRKVLHENLISLTDHAAYIGHEVARAEICLKEGKKFVQDEA
ncbi:MAG TPA: thymidylate synthase [archaeon]|nr:thymidylate synthase [archaeon]